METKHRDFAVGLFIVVTIGVILGALLVTSGLGEAHRDLFMRAATAQDLTTDTRVFLQGLAVGRVRQINPHVEAGTGRLAFVLRLQIDQRFPDGSRLELPRGTRAVISQPTLAAPVIDLETPQDGVPHRPLVAGDTIESQRKASTVDQMGEVASRLSNEVSLALADTRRLIARTTTAVSQTTEAVGRTEATIARLSPVAEQVLTSLATDLQRTDRILATVEPHAGPLQDSLAAALGQTRALLVRLDSLAGTAQNVVVQNQEALHNVMDRLQHTGEMLEHFTDQVSRRPTRLLTGVTPPPPAGTKDRDKDTTTVNRSHQ